MNLLFDMITTCRRTGAGEYVRRIFYALLDVVRQQQDIHVTCLYDSSRGIAYDDLAITKQESYGVNILDIHGQDLMQLLENYKIDRVFIGCAQFWHQYKGIDNIACEAVCVIHDLSHQEKWRNHIDEYNKLRKKSILALCYSLFRLRRHKGADHLIKPFITLAKNNAKAYLVVVFDYTRASLQYLTDAPMEKVKVLYSPLRLVPEERPVENTAIAALINNKEKFFVLLGAHISLKNGYKAIPAFARYIEAGGTGKLLTIGRGIKKQYDCQVTTGFISDSDLNAAFRHCHALIYPSLFEGFGYPPLEVMRYGKPVLCSSACSMPEVLEDAPIYFMPLYETAIFKALQTFDKTNYDTLVQRSRRQYEKTSLRQEADLQELLRLLTR